MTPILRGTASRLGLRKPQPPEVVEITPEVEALMRTFQRLGETIRQQDERARQSLQELNARLRRERL